MARSHPLHLPPEEANFRLRFSAEIQFADAVSNFGFGRLELIFENHSHICFVSVSREVVSGKSTSRKKRNGEDKDADKGFHIKYSLWS